MPTNNVRLFTKKIGNRVCDLRKQKGISQRNLSYDADIDISTLSRLERGLLNPRISTLMAIAKVLEVPVKELLDFD